MFTGRPVSNAMLGVAKRINSTTLTDHPLTHLISRLPLLITDSVVLGTPTSSVRLQWRFYVGARGATAPQFLYPSFLALHPQFGMMQQKVVTVNAII